MPLAGLMYIDTTPKENAVTVDAAGGSMATPDASITASRSSANGHAVFSASHFATDGNNLARIGDEKDGHRATTLHTNLFRDVGSWRVGAVFRGVEAEVEYDPTPFPAYTPADGRQSHDVGSPLYKARSEPCRARASGSRA